MRRPPNVSDLFVMAFLAAGLSADEAAFSMKQLSGYVHGTMWALYGQMEPLSEVSAAEDPRVTAQTPSINYVEIAYTIHTAATVFALAFTAQIRAFGWDEQRWRATWDKTAKELRRATAHIVHSEM